MSKKLTTEYVRGKVEERGWTMRSVVYVDAKTKLDLICPNGHGHSIRWNDFQSGYGCPVCAGTSKYKIGYVKECFEGRGCLLESTEYVGAHTKLDYTCPNGHKHSISFASFLQGHGCPHCSVIRISDGQRYDISYIRNEFDIRGCTLKSTEYINNHTKLDYICPNGHECGITWGSFQSGIGCPICAGINMSGKNHPNWRGGIDNDMYCDAWNDKDYKFDIRSRDNHRCQNPYCSCNGGRLCLHHIDYNKQNCSPSNLILLCNFCHGMSNFDREWHIAWYQTLMNKKYGYIYKENK